MQEAGAAAERTDESSEPRWSGPARQIRSRLRRWLRGPVVTTAALAAAGGFFLSAAVLTGRESAEARHSRHDELVALVESRHEHVEALEERLEGLRQRLAAAEQAADPAGGLRQAVEDAERAAGLRALSGPGIRLRLDDAKSDCPTGDPADCRIRDRDLQAAVNAVFAAGAEAVAINDERIVATSAIRNAGAAVLVNYHVLGPPYEIEAIGEPETLATGVRRSEFGADFAVWTERYGLEFDMETVEELALPAYGGSLRTREAEIVGGDAPSANPPAAGRPAGDSREGEAAGDDRREPALPDDPAARGEEVLP